MKVTALLRVGRNVSDLARAAAFYGGVLGFQPAGPVMQDPVLAARLGAKSLSALRMRLGGQEIELTQCVPQGASYPRQKRANDLAFQHIAIVTGDIRAACHHVLRHGSAAISTSVPVQLPVSSGGALAFKFRDPDGHPLEFLQFAQAAGQIASGFDHSAISVANVAASVAFYAQLGLALAARQVNRGPAQDALDGLTDVAVDVVALRPLQPAPHVELLCYRTPEAALAARYSPRDICADRLIFGATDGGLQMLRDPDGHVIVLDGRGAAGPRASAPGAGAERPAGPDRRTRA